MRRDYSLLVALSLLSICSIFCSITTTTSAFEWSSGGKPQVTRQAIAGLWRLTPQPTYPLKEFTVHPPPQPKDQINQQNKQLEEDVLLMLKEDGSFQQYLNDDDDDDMEEDDEDVDDQWSRFQQKQKQKQLEKATSDKSKQDDPASLALKSSPDQLVKGVWDFRDGKLILAADRPEATASSKSNNNQQPKQNRPPKQQPHQQESITSQKKPHLDKLIVGRVVATYESSLQDNPILLQQQNATAGGGDSLQPKPTTQQQNDDIQNTKQSSASSSTSGDKTDTAIDAHLSVPKGSLKMGKFFYPKNHPSFFEQPIYNPTTAHRRFQLKQVLGTLNTAKQQQEEGLQPEQMFERRDFYNKTFLLTAHPLKQRTAPPPSDEDNKMPWLKKNNNKRPDETINPLAESARIRVMQVKFFPNNTFCSLWGTGDAILRGRFDVFEKEVYGHWTTNFWMQVLRFGLGRSVSGSVYSEGRSLTHEDAKTYWGTKLRRINVTTTTTATTTTTTTRSDEDGKASDDNQPSTTTSSSSEALLEVEGSVMYGGVGAEPVGRFLMREMMEEELALQEDDDEEDDDDDDDDNDDDGEYDSLLDGSSSSLPRFWTDNDDDDKKNNNDKDMDWLSDENAFQ